MTQTHVTQSALSITKTQNKILHLVWKYRFITASQLQTLIGHKEKRRTARWLKDLREKGYLEWQYGHGFYERIVPATYFISGAGRKALRQGLNKSSPTVTIDRHDRERSDEFRQKVLLATQCAAVLADHIHAGQIQVVTPRDFDDERSDWYLVKEYKPDLVIAQQFRGQETIMLLVINQLGLPRSSIRHRVEWLLADIAHTWPTAQFLEFPVILLVSYTMTELIYLKRLVRRLRSEGRADADIPVRLTMASQLQSEGITAGIWEAA